MLPAFKCFCEGSLVRLQRKTSIWASERGTVDRIAQQVAQIIWVSVQDISNVYKITCTGHSVLEVLPLVFWMILLGLSIVPYSGNPKVSYDTVFRLGPQNINKSPFRCTYVVTPFGVAGRGKASREIAYIGHSVLWEPECTI